MATMQQLEAALIKAHRAGDTRAATAIANEIKRTRGQPASPAPKGKGKPAPKQEDHGYLEALGAGALEVPVNVMAAGYNGVAKLLDLVGENKMAERVRRAGKEGETRAMAQIKPRTKNYPATSAVGNIGAGAMLTAPLAEAVGAKLVQKGTQIAQKGGVKIGQAIADFGKGVAGQGLKAGKAAPIIAGSAAAGGGTALLTNQDVTTGAAVGGGIPIVGRVLGKTFGAGFDIAARRVGKVKAAEMLRKAVGNNLERVKSALATATADERQSLLQFLESKGIQIPQLAAVEKNVAQSGQAQPLREAAQRSGEELAGLRANVRRGGQTATEAEQIINQDRRNLMQATDEQRQSGLAAMDVGRTQVLPLEGQAAAKKAAADQITASGIVPRMSGLADRMDEQAAIMGDNPAIFPDMGLIQQTRGIGGAARNRAEGAVNTQIDLRDASREAQAAADALRAEGAKPININPLVTNLRKGASDAQYVNPDRAEILSDFANRLEARAAKFGGVIDANGFYEVRKNINQSIDRLMSGRDPQAIKQHTSKLLSELRPQIDDAIRAAGGDELLQSINTVATGLKDLEQQGVAANLARIQQQHPERFARIMEGHEPGLVRRLTNNETGDITEALGSRIVDVQKLAGASNPGVMRSKFYIPDETPGAVDLRRGIASEAADIMSPGVPIWARATGQLMAAKVPGGGRAGAVLEGSFGEKMKAKVLNQLAPALANPKNAAALMGEVPTSEVLANYIAGLSPQARNLMAQSLITGGLYSQKPNY